MKNLKELKVRQLDAEETKVVEGGWNWDAFLSAISSEYRAFKAFLRGEK